MTQQEIGIAIKERRKKLGINQQTLADLASVAVNTVVAIERGEGNPQLATLFTILDTLGLQIDINIKQLDYVYVHDMEAGILQETDAREYVFTYGKDYHGEPVCLAMPVRKEPYRSNHLFPYFYNMLSEGSNRQVQSMLHHIDENDDFGIMLATAGHDTIGAVTIKPM